MQSSRYSRQIVIKLEFYRQTSEKSSNAKFLENPPVGAAGRSVLCWQTRHGTANNRSSQFSERA